MPQTPTTPQLDCGSKVARRMTHHRLYTTAQATTPIHIVYLCMYKCMYVSTKSKINTKEHACVLTQLSTAWNTKVNHLIKEYALIANDWLITHTFGWLDQ